MDDQLWVPPNLQKTLEDCDWVTDPWSFDLSAFFSGALEIIQEVAMSDQCPGGFPVWMVNQLFAKEKYLTWADSLLVISYITVLLAL